MHYWEASKLNLEKYTWTLVRICLKIFENLSFALDLREQIVCPQVKGSSKQTKNLDNLLDGINKMKSV